MFCKKFLDTRYRLLVLSSSPTPQTKERIWQNGGRVKNLCPHPAYSIFTSKCLIQNSLIPILCRTPQSNLHPWRPHRPRKGCDLLSFVNSCKISQLPFCIVLSYWVPVNRKKSSDCQAALILQKTSVVLNGGLPKSNHNQSGQVDLDRSVVIVQWKGGVAFHGFCDWSRIW